MSDVLPTPNPSRAHAMADRITLFVGSLRFIGLFLLVCLLWFFPQAYFLKIDPYPYQAISTMINVLAILMTSLVLISQNHTEELDKKRDDLSAIEVDHVYTLNRQHLDLLLRVVDHLGIAVPKEVREGTAGEIQHPPGVET